MFYHVTIETSKEGIVQGCLSAVYSWEILSTDSLTRYSLPTNRPWSRLLLKIFVPKVEIIFYLFLVMPTIFMS